MQLKILCLALLFTCALGTTYSTGNIVWDIYRSASYKTLNDVYMTAFDGSLHFDLIDRWFFMFVNGVPARADVGPATITGAGNSYLVFDIVPSTIAGLTVTGSIRLDSSGWAVKVSEFQNPTASPISVTLENRKDDVGSDGSTIVILTSGGDTTVDNNDIWSLSTDNFASGDPIVAAAFGYVDSFIRTGPGYQNSQEQFLFSKVVTVLPGQTIGFLQVLGCIDPVLPDSNAITKANNFLDDALTMYNYVNPLNGVRVLNHLSSVQLARVVNWNFAAVVGGDPHGIDFSGITFDMPHTASTYCLYHDHSLQVNIHVEAKLSLISEVVVFVPEHNLIIHASYTEDDSAPVYTVNHQTVPVPGSSEDGFITTEAGPFQFFGPLGEFSRYQQSLISIGHYVTILGGWHPGGGAFFNVAITHKSEEVNFPSILQLRTFHPERSVGSEFYSSVIPDVWFSA